MGVRSRVQAWLVVAGSGMAAFGAAPRQAQAAVLAGASTVVVVFALAHGHAMTVRAAAALYAGRAVLVLVTAAALVLGEWPARAVHRAWARFDLTLHARLRAHGAAVTAGDHARALIARARAPRRSPAVAVRRVPMAEPAELAKAVPDERAPQRLTLHQ